VRERGAPDASRTKNSTPPRIYVDGSFASPVAPCLWSIP
jgi:hypothetical protein